MYSCTTVLGLYCCKLHLLMWDRSKKLLIFFTLKLHCCDACSGLHLPAGMSGDVPDKNIVWMAAYVVPKP